MKANMPTLRFHVLVMLVGLATITAQGQGMVLWTILLGIIFVSSVYDNLAMPQFSGSLLALMGISAGTYLGFELLGKKSASTDLGPGKEVLR